MPTPIGSRLAARNERDHKRAGRSREGARAPIALEEKEAVAMEEEKVAIETNTAIEDMAAAPEEEKEGVAHG